MSLSLCSGRNSSYAGTTLSVGCEKVRVFMRVWKSVLRRSNAVANAARSAGELLEAFVVSMKAANARELTKQNVES